MNHALASVSLAVSLAVPVSFVAAACDPFSSVSCVDDDCPSTLPVCASGACDKDDGGGRTGRPVDGVCHDDAECAGAHCYDVDDDSGFSNTCVPAGLDTSCSARPLQEALGPRSDVVFVDATIARDDACQISVGVPLRIDVVFLDRLGNAVTANHASLQIQRDGVSVNDGAAGYLIPTVAHTSDGRAGVATVGGVCANLTSGETFAIVLGDDDAHFTNAACFTTP